MSLKNELLAYIQKTKSKTYSFKDLSSILSSNRQEVAKAMIELRNNKDLMFEIITEDEFSINQLFGEEFKFVEKENLITQVQTIGLFDREGNIFINPNEFLEATANFQTKKYDIEEFKELEKLTGEEYEKKVLEIAHDNLRLIVRKIYPLTIEATSEELIIMYQHVLKGLCRAVEKHEYKRGNTFSTYALTWIMSGLGRARVSIVMERCKAEYKGFKPTYDTVSRRYALLNKDKEQGEYPKLNEVVETFKSESEIWLKEKVKHEQKKIEAEASFIGINRLFRELTEEPHSIPTEKQIEQILNTVNEIEGREKDMLIKRYGLFGDMKNKQGTLEEIGKEHNLTRERVRQLIKLSVNTLKLTWDSSSKFESFLKCTLKSVLNDKAFDEPRKSRRADRTGTLSNKEIIGIEKVLSEFNLSTLEDYINTDVDIRRNLHIKIGENLDWFLDKCLTFIENSNLLNIKPFRDDYVSLPISGLFLSYELEITISPRSGDTISEFISNFIEIDTKPYRHIFNNITRLNLILDKYEMLPLETFSERTRNVFVNEGINTLPQLTAHSKQSLLALKSFGATSLLEVVAYLDKLGIVLNSHLKDYKGEDLINFNKLSVRTRNCLDAEKIYTISKLEKHTEEELLSITNFGRTSLLEVIKYLSKFGRQLRKENNIYLSKIEKIKPKKQIPSVSSKTHRNKLLKKYTKLTKLSPKTLDLTTIDISKDLLIFPASGEHAFNNYLKTVKSFFPNNEIQKLVADTNLSIFLNQNEHNGYWGVNSTTRRSSKIATPCYGIFFKDKKGFCLVEIQSQFINTELSSVFWEKLSNTAFKHMFQIKSIAEIDLSQELFNELVGWSEKMVCRMFTHMKYPRSYQVLNHIKNNH